MTFPSDEKTTTDTGPLEWYCRSHGPCPWWRKASAEVCPSVGAATILPLSRLSCAQFYKIPLNFLKLDRSRGGAGPQTCRVGTLTDTWGAALGISPTPSIDKSVDAADVGVRATPRIRALSPELPVPELPRNCPSQGLSVTAVCAPLTPTSGTILEQRPLGGAILGGALTACLSVVPRW